VVIAGTFEVDLDFLDPAQFAARYSLRDDALAGDATLGVGNGKLPGVEGNAQFFVPAFAGMTRDLGGGLRARATGSRAWMEIVDALRCRVREALSHRKTNRCPSFFCGTRGNDSATTSPMESTSSHKPCSGRVFGPTEIERVRDLIRAHPQASRQQLSYRVCEAFDWRKPDGCLKDISCRGAAALLRLCR